MRDAGYIGAVTRGIQIAIVDFASCIQKPVLVDGGLERLQLKAAIPFESIAAQTDTQHASYNLKADDRNVHEQRAGDHRVPQCHQKFW